MSSLEPVTHPPPPPKFTGSEAEAGALMGQVGAKAALEMRLAMSAAVEALTGEAAKQRAERVEATEGDGE